MTSTFLVQPNKINGCAFWVDGDVNSRYGVNRAYKGLQNILYCPPFGSNIEEIETVRQTNNTWNNNFLTLGNYSDYPYLLSSNMTIEVVMKLTKTPPATCYPYSCHYSGGWGLQMLTSRTPRLAGYSGGAYTYCAGSAMTVGIPYYMVGKIASGSYINLQIMGLMANPTEVTFGAIAAPSSDICSRIGGQGSTETDITGAFDSLSIGMIRIWTRILTAAEIQERYLDAKERFGVL
jgi:hypothetical protein